MINYLWGFMILGGIIVGMVTGRIGDVSTASINSAKEAVTLCITMLGVMSLWTGLMQVARAAGIMDALTKGMEPVINFLFPDVPKKHKVREYIAANMIAKA